MTDDKVSYGKNIRVAYFATDITKDLTLGLKILICCKKP